MMALNMTSISLARGTKTADSYSAATALATEGQRSASVPMVAKQSVAPVSRVEYN